MIDAVHGACPYELVPASSFTIDALTTLYNAGRADYIVPMSMEADHLKAYIHTYDVNLDASNVILNKQRQPAGLGLLGIRDDRCWITRLGIIPSERKNGLGKRLVEALITGAHRYYARQIQLEVIEGNDGAHRLFMRSGFHETRRLRLLHRHAQSVPTREPLIAGIEVKRLAADELWASLAQRGPGASWVNENASLAKIDHLEGLQVTLSSGYSGWIIFQRFAAQVTHVVLQAPAQVRQQMTMALLYHLHRLYGTHDITLENIPVADISPEMMHQLNYTEKFRRIEMVLRL